LWNRMTLLIGWPIDQHVKSKRICKSVASFGVSELAEHYRLWRRGMPRNNQSCGCQGNKMPTPLVSQQCSDDGSWDRVSSLTVMVTTTRKWLRVKWKHWSNNQNIWSSHLLSKCSKISCKIITSSISNKVQAIFWLVLFSWGLVSPSFLLSTNVSSATENVFKYKHRNAFKSSFFTNAAYIYVQSTIISFTLHTFHSSLITSFDIRIMYFLQLLTDKLQLFANCFSAPSVDDRGVGWGGSSYKLLGPAVRKGPGAPLCCIYFCVFFFVVSDVIR
jgi:hypothetical protein